MHRLLEIDRVQDFDFVPGIREHLSAFNDDRTFRVSTDIADLFGHLHQIGLYEKPCLAAARAADHNDILVSGILRMLWSAAHHQPFRLGKQHIILEYRVNKRFNVLGIAPPGRAVFLSLTILLCVLPLKVDHGFQCCCTDQTHQQVERMDTWQITLVGQTEVHKKNHQPVHDGIAITVSVQPCGFLHHVKGDNVRKIQQDQLFHICRLHLSADCRRCFLAPCRSTCLVGGGFTRTFALCGRFLFLAHRTCPLSFVFSLMISRCLATRSFACSSFLRMDCRCSFFSETPVYSLNAAVITSTSFALKKTRYSVLPSFSAFFRL